MAEQEEERGVFGRVREHLWNRVKAIVPETLDAVTEKVIPHGAAELSQAINTGSAYVPYGTGQAPLEPAAEQGSVYGKAPEQTYEQLLDQYRGRGQDDPGKDKGIDR